MYNVSIFDSWYARKRKRNKYCVP